MEREKCQKIIRKKTTPHKISKNLYMFFSKRNGNFLFLFLILLFGAFYYSLFSFSIAMPQMGWWQYYGWRITQGDIPYKDFYFYLPPYHALYSALLYLLFGNKVIYYTIFGFFINKALCWGILYNLLTRKFQPWQVTIGMIAGIVINSVYQMDLTFDYNPLVTLLWILILYFLVRMYETGGKKADFYIFLNGIICGVLIMTKQNVGLAAPVMILIIMLFISTKKKIEVGKNIFLTIFGIVIGIMPGLIYLLTTDSLYEAIYCITSAMGAKGVGNGFFITTFRNCWRPSYLAIAFAVLGLFYLIGRGKNDVRKTLYCFFAALFLGIDTSIYLTPIWKFFNSNNSTKLSTVIILFTVVVAVFLYWTNKKKNATVVNFIAYFLMFVCGVGVSTILEPSVRRFFFETLDMFNLRRGMLYVFFYLEIFLWIHMVKRLFQKNNISFSYFMVLTGILLYIAVSFTSAPLEELYGVTFVPLVISEALSKKTKWNRVKNHLILLTVVTVVCLCSFEKTTMPYEWHSWKIPALYDKQNPLTASNISGLKGLYLSYSDENKYEEIVKGIENNSSENDIVYQFPNIMLFNVLTNRKTVYDAVPYFDVCPDSEAIKSSEDLKKNPPEMVLWSNLNEDRWAAHESQYRNGNLSGQRSIQDWFNNYVKCNYRKVGEWDNNEGDGDTISLWKRVTFWPGELTKEWELDPKKAFFFQTVVFQKDSFDTYFLCVRSEQNIEDIPVDIHLINSHGETIDTTSGKLTKAENGLYSIASDNKIHVNTGEGYVLNVTMRPEAKISIGRTEDNTATDSVFAFDGKNRFDFNVGIYCE